MLDAIKTDDNIIISPMNINLSLGILYNATDNNTKKEIKNYFHEEPQEINNLLNQKIAKLNNNVNAARNNYELYEQFIQEINDNHYFEYTLKNIEKLKQVEKEKLILLIIKTNLAYDRMTNNQEAKLINNYKLTDKEKAYSSYQIKELLDKVIDNYSTYRLNNQIKNYNVLYYNKELTINKQFKKNIEDYYKANINPLDYNNLIEAKNTINNNLKEFQAELNRVISDNDLEDNNFVMINSLNFNYKWQDPFDYKMIIDSEFVGFEDKHYLVEMMYSKENLYLENNFATGFIKNFADDKYSFIAILPKEEGDFSLSKLDIENLIKNQKETDVLIGLPTFNYSSTVDLNQVYSSLNIKEISSNKANLSKMTDTKESLSKNIQKINISIGDKGTLNSNLVSLSIDSFNTDEIDRKVILNRPFAFLIIDNETQDTILIGKYTTPNN
jgi:serpin B